MRGTEIITVEGQINDAEIGSFPPGAAAHAPPTCRCLLFAPGLLSAAVEAASICPCMCL